MGFLDVEAIFPVHVDMSVSCRPDMGQIAVLYPHAFLLELLHDSRHVDCIPDDDRIGHQIETQRLLRQGLPPTLAQLALVGDH